MDFETLDENNFDRNRKFMERLNAINSLMGITITNTEIPTVQSRKTKTPGTKLREREGVESKFDEKLKYFIIQICENRPRLQFDKVYSHAMEIMRGCNLKPERGKDNTSGLAVYLILTSVRIQGEYLDPVFVGRDLDICPKKISKYLDRFFPPINTRNDLERRIVNAFFTNTDHKSVCMEYIEYFQRDVEFPKDCETIVTNYIENSKLLISNNVCDEEKQFCVTPSKIIEYTIMEHYRSHIKPEIAEKELIQSVSQAFGIPRITLDKMKRIMFKIRKTA